jgi:hypothetical protein
MKATAAAIAAAASLALASLALASPAHAGLSFSFSWDRPASAGLVEGVFRGLSEGTGLASSVEVLSTTAGFGIGEYIGNPTANRFTVRDGELVRIVFAVTGMRNSPPAVTTASIGIIGDVGEKTFVGISERTDRVGVSRGNGFSVQRLPDGAVSVPAPSTSVLFACALAACALSMGWAARRRATVRGDVR